MPGRNSASAFERRLPCMQLRSGDEFGLYSAFFQIATGSTIAYKADMAKRSLTTASTWLVLAALSAFVLTPHADAAPDVYPVTPKAVESTRFRVQVDGETVAAQVHQSLENRRSSSSVRCWHQ